MAGLESQSHAMPRQERGRLVADILAGAWRPGPTEPDLLEDEYLAIAPILARTGSGGLAWWRVRGYPLYRHYTLHAALLEERLVEVVRYLRAVEIEPILMKGWSIGRHYAEKGLRPYGDLDLIVAPSDYAKATKALATPDRPDAPIELHTDGHEMHELADRTVAELFQRSHRVELSGTNIRVLAGEDEMRLLALHGLKHGHCRPLMLCDVAVALESLPEDFDWLLCMGGDEWRSEGVRCGLGLARELLGASLERVPKEWKYPPLPHWLVPAALHAWGAKQHYMDRPHPVEQLKDLQGLRKTVQLRWANPIEVTYRRQVPWDDSSRGASQVADFISRSLGVLWRLPKHMIEEREARELAEQAEIYRHEEE